MDVEEGKILENVDILIENRVISRIGRDIGETAGETRDMKGSFISPGLFNVHSHLSLPYSYKGRGESKKEPEASAAIRCFKRANDALLAGVTTVRTVGDPHRCDIHLRNAIREGHVRGPRIVAGGRAIGATGGHGGGDHNEADGADEFLRVARRELSEGAEHLKIFLTGGMAGQQETPEEIQMTEDEITAVTSVAKSKGTYVTAHAGGSHAIIEATKLGVTCFEHGYALNREAAQAIKGIGGFFVPTLAVTRCRDWYEKMGFDQWLIEKSLGFKTQHDESFKTAISEKVAVVCGTDVAPGDSESGVNITVREIGWMNEAGLSPLDSLRSATINAAKLCKLERTTGVVKAGLAADLIATPSNPLASTKNLESIHFVMTDGVVVRNEME